MRNLNPLTDLEVSDGEHVSQAVIDQARRACRTERGLARPAGVEGRQVAILPVISRENIGVLNDVFFQFSTRLPDERRVAPRCRFYAPCICNLTKGMRCCARLAAQAAELDARASFWCTGMGTQTYGTRGAVKSVGRILFTSSLSLSLNHPKLRAS